MRIVGWIRQGDRAACGASVAEGEARFSNMGQAFAFQGAAMSCPQHCVIAEGFPGSVLSGGRIRVVHGMTTSGGCPLLSTLNDLDGISNASGHALPSRFVRDEQGNWHGRTDDGYDQQCVLPVPAVGGEREAGPADAAVAR